LKKVNDANLRLRSFTNIGISSPAHPPKWCAFLYLQIGEKVVNPMAMNPAKFIREVRTEVGKVTWPTRKETIISTIMVLVLAFVAALFFLAVDGIFAVSIRWILGLGQ
jgi:preprotein translocase subunit SecE